MTSKFQFRGFIVLCALALLASGCGQKANETTQKDQGEPAAAPGTQLVSSLKMNAPTAKEQLTKGFFQLESGAWRWSAGNFTITLKTPPGAAQKGATLTLNLVASGSVLKQVHSQSLTAAIGSKPLKTEKYVDAGAHTFTADVPASLLTGDTVAVDFSLDNSLPPSAADRRELGVIVTAASLDSN
ncbi:MAG TPA: hypothetical protein VGM43_03630 [Bryobacteraceae bacterium]|jgi:hypothetical protein